MTIAKLSTKLIIGLSLYSSLAIVNASDSVDAFEQSRAKALASFEDSKQQKVDKFEQSKAEYLSAFNAAKERLSKKWDKPNLTGKTTWVQYSNQDSIRRTVDFESGAVTVEVVGSDVSEAELEQIVKTQVVELESQTTKEAYKKDSVLANTSSKPSKIESKAKVLPGVDSQKLLIAQHKSSYTQKNGLKVTRVSMAVPQNKVAERAMIYMPHVQKMADKWNIEPELILAIMHTESHFNPMAQSHIPAYGLMQVVPNSAGKDVTKRYLGEEKVLPAEVLFNPEFNIDIGTGYLNILDKHYLRNVENPESRVYLSISSYNGGVGAVAKHITGKSSLSLLAKEANKRTPDDLFQDLATEFPYKETRDYLKKVSSKRDYYAKLLTASEI